MSHELYACTERVVTRHLHIALFACWLIWSILSFLESKLACQLNACKTPAICIAQHTTDCDKGIVAEGSHLLLLLGLPCSDVKVVEASERPCLSGEALALAAADLVSAALASTTLVSADLVSADSAPAGLASAALVSANLASAVLTADIGSTTELCVLTLPTCGKGAGTGCLVKVSV